MATARDILRPVGKGLALGGKLLLALILLLAGFGGAAHLSRMQAKPPYEMVEVEAGRRLHVVCEGPASAPFILYDAGAFGIYTDGWWIKEALKDDHRVCLYDRAGMGWSDPVPADRSATPEWHVGDMRRLRSALGAEGPFVLIGHSMAGMRLHAFANLHPEELSGLVFVDAARPDPNLSSRFGRLAPWILRAMSVGAAAARTGLAGGLAFALPDELDLPKQQKRDKRRSIGSVRHHKSTKAEIVAALAEGANDAWIRGDGAETLPVAVFANSEGGGSNGVVAEAAQTRAGFGRVTSLPDDTHVSVLNRTNAQKIAADVRAMLAFSGTP